MRCAHSQRYHTLRQVTELDPTSGRAGSKAHRSDYRKLCRWLLKQAHERIIGERPVANDEKLLSLFEPDIHAIVRGKAGEEVEFGNLLVLGEQRAGLIMDWELFKEEVPADTRLVRPSVERVESGLELSLKS